MKKLIVTADDYGMSKAVNAAIEQGGAVGLITATNVMTNMEYFENAKYLKKECPSMSVGLHWTLSCGTPVCTREEIPSLVDEKTLQFFSYPEFRKRYRAGKISNIDIQKELTAQYNRFKAALGAPDYWNTHQNVHVDFRIFQVFAHTAEKLHIKKMRSHQRIYVPAQNGKSTQPFIWRAIEPAKAQLLNHWMAKQHKKGVQAPDGLIVCLNEQDTKALGYVFSNIKWGRAVVGEYVIHPAIADDSPYFGKIVEKRMEEYRLFTAVDTKNMIEQAGIELVNYAALGD